MDTEHRKRRSLRNSVLKNPRNSSPHERSSPHTQSHTDEYNDRLPDSRDFFSGLGPFRHNDKDEFFPSFGFGGMMNPFGDNFNEMMEKFFSDFNPESFMDSRSYQEDRDLDEDISKEGLDRALDKKEFIQKPQSFMRGFSYSESTVTKSDGTIERKVTRKDSEGNVETTVTVTGPDGTTQVMKDPFDSGECKISPRDGVITDFHGTYQPDDEKGLFRSIYDNLKKFFPD